MSKPAKIIFTLSLILNILFIGMFFGQFHHAPKEKEPWKEMKASLAPETRDVLKATFKEKGKDVFPIFKQAHQEKNAMKAIIMAEEFDESSYDIISGELKDLGAMLMDHRMEFIKDVLSQLPQSERVMMADHAVERMLKGPPKKPGREGLKKGLRPRESRGDMGPQGEAMKRHHGAIQPAPGRGPFEAKSAHENGANQGK